MANKKPVKLAYNSFDPVGGEDTTLSPIIFLHGVTAIKEYWKDIPQIIATETKRKTYAIDSRNHGDSEYTEEFTFDLNVVDLFHFMDTINASKAVLVGHSMGGCTAINAALQKPERVEVMISEDMFAKKIPREIIQSVCEFTNHWVINVRNIPKEVLPKDAETLAINLLYNQIPENSPLHESRDQIKNIALEFKYTPEKGYDVKFNKEAIEKGLQNYEEFMSELSGQYNGPAYFIYGGISQFQVGKEEETIKSHFPKAELIEFEKATHLVHIEFPEKFAETIVRILTK